MADVLGIDLGRNLDQCRDGAADAELSGYAIEVKRGERFRSAWIEQANEQAGDRMPVLVWCRDRQPSRFMVLADLDGFVAVTQRD